MQLAEKNTSLPTALCLLLLPLILLNHKPLPLTKVHTWEPFYRSAFCEARCSLRFSP